MNIAINTLPLSTEHRMRGTGVYTKNLIDALKKYGKSHTYSFFTRVQDIPADTDLVHYPFFDPFFLTLPFFRRYKTVVTVHDVIPLVFPDKFRPGLRGEVKWQMQRLSLLRSQGVITDSNCSKEDIMRVVGLPSSRVHVVPLAPSVHYQRVQSASMMADVRARYRLPDTYVLYVGDVNWNKNVLGLLDAWKLVKNRFSKSDACHLVLVGSAFTDSEVAETREILHRIEVLGIGKTITRPGFVKNEDMAAVYSAAVCTVLPSWYEGFGFPVLEAMACGVPVVATNRGSVPEIAGPARVADPADSSAFSEAILSCVRMPPEARRELVREGFAWAKQFTWERVAQETIRAYEQTLGKSGV